MHGIRLREGMVESEKLDEPVVTPSTKAEQGAHDENISPEKGIKASPTIVGTSLMRSLQPLN